jgi:hypothetical protein
MLRTNGKCYGCPHRSMGCHATCGKRGGLWHRLMVYMFGQAYYTKGDVYK